MGPQPSSFNGKREPDLSLCQGDAHETEAARLQMLMLSEAKLKASSCSVARHVAGHSTLLGLAAGYAGVSAFHPLRTQACQRGQWSGAALGHELPSLHRLEDSRHPADLVKQENQGDKRLNAFSRGGDAHNGENDVTS